MKNSSIPNKILFNNELIVKIRCGQLRSLLLTDNGLIYASRHNEFGQIGNRKRKIN
jgi:alpha-tubulin suppressor-like RCC1 family protein